MYIMRYTSHPELDALRSLVAWAGIRWKSRAALAEFLMTNPFIPVPGFVWDAHQRGNIDVVADHLSYAIGFRHIPSIDMWTLDDAEGLRCWPLSAETRDGALREARALWLHIRSDDTAPFRAVGVISYVGRAFGPFHLFWCDHVEPVAQDDDTPVEHSGSGLAE